MIKLEKVNKYFNRYKRNQIHIINNTSLELGDTGLVAILGQSGSGKTTLLNAIGGLDKVNRGKIYINGKKITRRTVNTVDRIRNLNIGYIFQDYKLIENLSVYENIAMALRMIGITNKKEIDKRVNYVLEAVKMERYKKRPALMLSGGEKQRVSIARALAKNPSIVIADEPTGNLDSKNSLEVMNIIKAISKEKLVILVTHEVDLAKFYASRILEIKAYLPNNPIDLSKISHFDKEKIDLYIANQFLLFAENATLEEKQRFLYHVTSYFLSDENRKTDTNLKIQCGNVNNNEFQVNESGYEITPKNLYDRYKKLLIDNPTLHAIDFRGVDFSNMNLCEVEDYMNEFLNDLSANWEFLPKDDRTVEKNVLDNIVKSSNKEENEKKKKLDRERLLDLYMEKKEFYDSSDPFFRIKGKNTFDGYIGYIYSNGKVILEKYYENSNTSRLAYGEAAYVMDIDKFYSLSRLTKTELITMD